MFAYSAVGEILVHTFNLHNNNFRMQRHQSHAFRSILAVLLGHCASSGFALCAYISRSLRSLGLCCTHILVTSVLGLFMFVHSPTRFAHAYIALTKHFEKNKSISFNSKLSETHKDKTCLSLCKREWRSATLPTQCHKRVLRNVQAKFHAHCSKTMGSR